MTSRPISRAWDRRRPGGTFRRYSPPRSFTPSIEKRMLDAQAEPAPDRNPSCLAAEESGRRLARAVLEGMDAMKLDALVYPSWNNPPRLIGDLNSPHGNNS